MSIQEEHYTSSGLVRPYRVPTAFVPQEASRRFPDVNPQLLGQVQQAGWARFGIVSAVLNHQDRLLLLEHRPSDKSPAGALGPLAETGQLSRLGGLTLAESIPDTLARATREELGVAEPARLQLAAQPIGAWALNQWPVGTSYADQHALAVCPVVHLGKDQSEELLDTFAGTEEISGVRFVDPYNISSLDNVRPGTQEWLLDMGASGLLSTPPSQLEPLVLPDGQPLPGAIDIKFDQIGPL